MNHIHSVNVLANDFMTMLPDYRAVVVSIANSVQAGNFRRAVNRPRFGRPLSLVGQVVWVASTARWYAVAAENAHSVVCHPVIALWGRWEVVTAQRVTFSKSQIEVQ